MTARRGPRTWAAIGLSAVSGATFIVIPLLPWLDLRQTSFLYLFGEPTRPGSSPGRFVVHPRGFPIDGLSTGPGKWVFAAGVVALALAVLAGLLHSSRLVAWLVGVPALLVASAVGQWHRALGDVPTFGHGWSLLALVGVLAASLAIGLWARPPTVSGFATTTCSVLALATLVCGVSSLVGTQGTAIMYLFDRLFDT